MSDEPLLLTPGPLTTSKATKKAMLRDWGSRDGKFIELTAGICQKIEAIAGVDADNPSHSCVLIQGSGTFAVEATIDSLVPRDGKVLVLINGAYGLRIAKICEINGRDYVTLETAENEPPTADQVADYLKKDPAISYVVAVHCETTSGILNPIADIAGVISEAGRLLIIDAMSSFGALPLDVGEVPCAAIIASSNKCLEGVPGIGFAIIDKTVLAEAGGNATSLSLDLVDQWQNFEKTGQWRFTPPTHVLAALNQALLEHEAEGGVNGRGQRYQENCQTLVNGMNALGFKTYLSGNLQAPIIVTFHLPAANSFKFEDFYDRLNERGFAIYPGKLTKVDSFRIGCIGHLTKTDIENAVAAVAAVLAELD
jgi:2-aminoethylphosphonate-pyruvate transaminase